ncbi:hypothetical protein VB638_16760 [Dolichospermum sp. UHCC 0684]|nr:hypothetical protein [Dolichospermum sp. UHCC 0684]
MSVVSRKNILPLPLAPCLLPSLREFNDEEGTQNLVDLAISE